MTDRPLPEPRWLIGPAPDGEIHVTPIGDLTDHPRDTGCACGPTTEPVPRTDGTTGWMHTHHSLDGRERHERPVNQGPHDTRPPWETPS